MTYVEDEPLRVRQTKARLGRLPEPFLVTISDTQNGGVLVSAGDARQRSPVQGEKFDTLCRSVLEFVRQRPGASARWILEQVGGRYTAVKAALEVWNTMAPSEILVATPQGLVCDVKNPS